MQRALVEAVVALGALQQIELARVLRQSWANR